MPRLTTLIPELPSPLANGLAKCGIRTDTELLSSQVVELYRQLPLGSTSLADLEDLRLRVAALASATGASAAEVLRQESEAKNKSIALTTGVTALDDLLGGFGGCRVLEISGDHQSGKTILALNLVVRYLVNHIHGEVVWLDTTGNFPIQSLSQLLAFSGSEETTALKRLKVSLTLDLDAAYAVIDESVAGNDRCIVIDTITALLRPLLSGSSAQGHAIMVGFMRQLRLRSRHDSYSILVLNDSVFSHQHNGSDINRSLRSPALGPSFAFMTDATLWLTKEEDKQECSELYSIHAAQVLRSKTTPLNLCTFRISSSRILADH